MQTSLGDREEQEMRSSPFTRHAVSCAAIVLAGLQGPLALAASDLTGRWAADDGSVYYVTQLGDTVWWAGFDPDPFSPVASKSNSFQRGLTSTQVFRGTLSGDLLSGDWAEVPRQSDSSLHQGTAILLLHRDSIGDVVRLQTQSATGGLAAKSWTRSSPLNLPCTNAAGDRDPYCLFAKVLKNQTSIWGSHESLLDNLKPYKDNAVVFGTVTDPYSLGLSTGSGLTCSDFFRLHDKDGDLNFDITVDRQDLDAQPAFWTDGWINSAAHVRGKLDAWQDSVHCELIMFGRQNGNCQAGDPVFLPGWAETGANSALANGMPISGGIAVSAGLVLIKGATLQMRAGSRVRVTGPIVLDCGHSSLRHPGNPCYESENDSGNLDTKNLEIHPVYSVDVLQDFTLPRQANLDLTGSWAATDVGTYYVRQIGNTVWWLGLSRDHGLTFASVFRGVVHSGGIVAHPVGSAGSTSTHAEKASVGPASPPVISGQWASLPLGGTQGNGSLTLSGTFCKQLNGSMSPCDPAQPAGAWNLLVTQSSSSPLFANPSNGRFQWQKMFDRISNPIPQIVAPTTFPMGPVGNGLEATSSVPIGNSGNAPLVIQSISSSVPALKFTPSTLTIAPGAMSAISLRWLVATATSSGNHVFAAVLGLASNDPSRPHAAVTVELTVHGGPAR
jgi:hypothetical protein